MVTRLTPHLFEFCPCNVIQILGDIQMAPDLTNGASRHVEKQDEVSLRPTFKPSCNISHTEHCGPSHAIGREEHGPYQTPHCPLYDTSPARVPWHAARFSVPETHAHLPLSQPISLNT